MNEPWLTHEWLQPTRVLKINGKWKREYFCVRCKRTFIELIKSQEYFAAIAGIMDFEPLPAYVTVRWLAEKCPGHELPEDAEAYRSHRHK